MICQPKIIGLCSVCIGILNFPIFKDISFPGLRVGEKIKIKLLKVIENNI